MSFGSKIYWFIQYIRFFSSISDVRTFSTLRKSTDTSAGEFELGVRAVPGSKLICRSGTSDSQVLLDVFWDKLHHPEKALPENPTILDLGVNVGYSCFDLATSFPGARIFGVELDDENAQLACRNTQIFGKNCQIIQAAVWFEDGIITYSKTGEEWGYQVLRDTAARETEVHSVRAISIDTLMQEVGIDWVDFIKMDIEGAEEEVLVANANWLQRTGALNIEIHPPATYEKCEALLTEAGFSCKRSTRHEASILAFRQI